MGERLGDDNVREDFEGCYVAFCGAEAVDFVDQHSVDVPIRVQVCTTLSE